MVTNDINDSIEKLSAILENSATSSPTTLQVIVVVGLVSLILIALYFHARVIQPWIESVLQVR